MRNLKAITFLLAIALTEITANCYNRQPLLLKYHDDSGNVRMSLVKDSNWKRYQAENSDSELNSSSDEASEDESVNAHLHEYALRDGPHEDSDSVQDKYNISEEEEYENAEVYNESDDEEVSSKHPYADDFSDLEFETESHEKPQKYKPSTKNEKPSQKHEKPSKSPRKIVYVYKQPPIIVKPKPTNVYIKSKPIIVQPPPLVVHHPQPKPCNPVIKYQPPNIKLRPVIVKISKPKPSKTTTTTPCTTTTKKPPRKSKKPKPTKSSCNRCSRRKNIKNIRPEDFSFYLNQHQQPQYVQYKNVKYNEGVLT